MNYRLYTILQNTWSIILLHNPFTKGGRTCIKDTVLASGPATARFPKPESPWKFSGYPGWRFGSLVACCGVGICLMCTILFLGLAIAYTPVSNGVGTLYEGDCQKVRTLNTWLHVLLNGCATVLIGASNYNMQCLVAPSRDEIDVAHSKGIWLDIGVPSFRNLRHISRRRLALWLILALSTVPLHLLWNSAIFSTLPNNSYAVLGISADFLQEDCGQCPLTLNQPLLCEMYTSACNLGQATLPLRRLETGECIERYSTDIQGRWTNLVIVVDSNITATQCGIPFNQSHPLLFLYETYGIFRSPSYHCNGETAHPALVRPNQLYIPIGATVYKGDTRDYSFPAIYPTHIDYCLAMESPEICKLGFSLPILIIVSISDAIKFLAMVCTLKTVTASHIVTLGDAIASFLLVPDECTIGRCMRGIDMFKKTPYRFALTISPKVFTTHDAKAKKANYVIWFRAVSARRWISVLLL